jgi:hypothetical protein
MVATAWRGSIYLFGGVGAAGTASIHDVSGDLWRLDPQSLGWERLGDDTPGAAWPAPRRYCGLASGPEGLYLWGGSGIEAEPSGETRYTFLNDLWLFRPDARQWGRLEPSDRFDQAPLMSAAEPRPEPRYTPVWHVEGGRGLVFGGYTEDRLGKRAMNDLWGWQGRPGAWTRIPEVRPDGYGPPSRWPGSRYGCMSAADGEAVYVCGGSSAGGDRIDLWRWSWSRGGWELLWPDSAPGPPARYCAACTLYGGGLWVFGGRSRVRPKDGFNDTWRFDLAASRWERIGSSGPPHRYDAGAPHIAYHAKSSSARIGAAWYLWGGEGLHGHVSDLWRFDLDRCEWTMLMPGRADDPVLW